MLSFNTTDELFVGDELLKDFSSCTDCGICCKFFSNLPLFETEMQPVISSLNISQKKFLKKYIKKTDQNDKQKVYSLKTPCPFLNQNSCGIYENRFLVCRTFPFFINLTRDEAILTGIYLCPQATQFYEGMLDYYRKYHISLSHQLIEKEKEITIEKNGMEITGPVSLFSPYLDWITID